MGVGTMNLNISNTKRSFVAAAFMGFAAVTGFAAPANAAIIDFTLSNWLGAGSFSQTIDGNLITVSSLTLGGVLNSDSVSDPGAAPCTLTEVSCQTDGIGINDDEVGGVQILRVSFGTAVNIFQIGFLDLFTPSLENIETASWTTDQSHSGSLPGDGSNDNGFAGVTFLSDGLVGVSFIDFFVDSINSNSNSDFALAYINVGESTAINEVPLPASAYLFGTALLAMGALGRRRRKNQAAI